MRSGGARAEKQSSSYASDGLAPARVAAQHRGGYVVYAASGERTAEVIGRLRHAVAAADLPAVGDWVAVADGSGDAAAMIHAVLERTTAFSRRGAGEDVVEQVLAANVDVVFVVSAFGRDLNLRRPRALPSPRPGRAELSR